MTTSTTDPSSATNVIAIFEAASNEYRTLTGQVLETHPFAAALEDCVSPSSVLNVFRKQARVFDTFRKGEDKLMTWLTPIVYILFSVSEILGKGISLPSSPTKTLFTAISVFLGEVRADIASYEALVNQFERIHSFLRRLDHCTFIPEMTELLAKIMAQIISVLTLSTKAIKENRIKKLMKKVVRKTDVEDALQRLDLLTKEENLMMVMARNLEDTHHFDDDATVVEEIFPDVHDNVRATQELSYDVGSDVKEANLDAIKLDLRSVDNNVKATKLVTGEHQWNQSREKLRTWLSAPNPSINHNAACNSQHDGTTKWFIRGDTFNEWKKNGSLLWIHGNPGSGKSVLCSAITEDIKQMRLPANLDDTYERILHGIPKQLRRHAHRLFRCMAVASRPLRVEELAEIITIEYGWAAALSVVVKGRRPANPEAVLSACSSLISIIIDEKGSKIVQFSDFSVKEFLMSDRIQNVGKIGRYHIALEPAHTIMARLCLTVLLQLDENVDKTRLAKSPLALYAAQHWIDHASFGNVASRIQDAMGRLFNPKKPHFRAWIWLRRSANKQSMEKIDDRPPQPELTPLYYAALFGFGDLARRLIVTHKENVNASFYKWTPLHAASEGGHFDAVRVLLNHGARMNARLEDGRKPLHLASRNGHLKVVQLLLKRRAASKKSNTRTDLNTPLCLAAKSGHIEVVRVFLDYGAEVNIQDERNWSPYEAAKRHGQHDVMRLLRDHGGK